MTRKRFIKLCMAYGESRNEARVTANFVLMDNKTIMRINRMYKSFGDTFRLPMSSYEKEARSIGVIGGSKQWVNIVY